VLKAVLAGYILSTVLGFLILSFGGLVCKNGTTGTEYVGFWDPAWMLFWAGTFGSIPGTLSMPLAYFTCLRPVPRELWPRAIAIGAAFTLVGGLLGALRGPWLALVTGFMGFGLACWYVRRMPNRGVHPTAQEPGGG
jgi:hypothetical protein